MKWDTYHTQGFNLKYEISLETLFESFYKHFSIQ